MGFRGQHSTFWLFKPIYIYCVCDYHVCVCVIIMCVCGYNVCVCV